MSELVMKYFVLKPRGDDPYAAASRTAMHAYARAIRAENPELADDLVSWAATEGSEAFARRLDGQGDAEGADG